MVYVVVISIILILMVFVCSAELIHTVMEQLVGMGYTVSEDEEDDETYITIRWD